MGLILHKELSAGLSSWMFMVRLVGVWVSLMVVRSLKLSLTIYVAQVLCMGYLAGKAHDENN